MLLNMMWMQPLAKDSHSHILALNTLGCLIRLEQKIDSSQGL